MRNASLKLVATTHPLNPLFPNLTATEIDKLLDIVKSGTMPPLVGRLSEGQRAMVAAHIVTHVHGRGGNNKTPPGGINLTTAASLLGISADTVQMARQVIANGTPEEISKVYAGTMPVAVGRDILNGLTPEQRKAKRPHDGLRVSPTRRPSIFAERVLEMMAADEAKRARKAEQHRLRREKAKAAQEQAASPPEPTSPAAAPTLVETLMNLAIAAQEISPQEAQTLFEGYVTQSDLNTLIEWLIDITYKRTAP